jgi:hypothetical protein
MALTLSTVRQTVLGNVVTKYVDVTLDNSYPTGGESFTPSMVGFRSKDFLQVTISPAGGYIFEYDYTNRKILARMAAAPHTHTLFLNNADVADGASARVNAGSNLLGANTGSDISVTGVADTTGHGGIVKNSAPSANGEAAATQLANTSNVLDGIVIRVKCEVLSS